MEDLCDCDDWAVIKKRDVFKWHPPYGWVLSWIELEKAKGYTKKHEYGMKIYYCPMCGKKLEEG
jgi:hypothetical protein